MPLARCASAQLTGLTTEMVAVEVDISTGLNAVSIVGLGDRAVTESRDRVSAAIKNSGYISPKQKNQKVVISLAPADMRKEGPSFDLAIALAYLSAAGDIPAPQKEDLFLGELSLEGDVCHVAGILPIICHASRTGFKRIFIPARNAPEVPAQLDAIVYCVSTLRELLDFLAGRSPLAPLLPQNQETGARPQDDAARTIDMRLIRGNASTKRGLLIAAAGAHNLLLHGPPGTGKTMLAQAFPTLLPPLTHEESLEVTGIHSAARALKGGLVREAPFRTPHHTASYASMVGGGSFPRPGEITLAHRGVLFLDELPEFKRTVLEALRQPLESRFIEVARARGTIRFPAQCILIGAMNPCPCGKPRGQGCICSDAAVRNYRRRVSGPIMDRLDLWLNAEEVDYERLSSADASDEGSGPPRERVAAARAVQLARFKGGATGKRHNSELDASDIDTNMRLDGQARTLLAALAERLSLSGRAFHRVMKVSRTIADLAAEDIVRKDHILEAVSFRQTMQ